MFVTSSIPKVVWRGDDDGEIRYHEGIGGLAKGAIEVLPKGSGVGEDAMVPTSRTNATNSRSCCVWDRGSLSRKRPGAERVQAHAAVSGLQPLHDQKLRHLP